MPLRSSVCVCWRILVGKSTTTIEYSLKITHLPMNTPDTQTHIQYACNVEHFDCVKSEFGNSIQGENRTTHIHI